MFRLSYRRAERQETTRPQVNLDTLLGWVEELASDLTIVVTVNARHQTAFELNAEYIESLRQHGTAGFVLSWELHVLSEEERELDGESRIVELVKSSRSKLPSTPTFL